MVGILIFGSLVSEQWFALLPLITDSVGYYLCSFPVCEYEYFLQSKLFFQKLKQALASSSTAARPGCSKISRANTADRIAEMTRSRNFSGTSSTEVSCLLCSTKI